jgi:uncharacterized membrane protein YhaH (DUF805 family)
MKYFEGSIGRLFFFLGYLLIFVISIFVGLGLGSLSEESNVAPLGWLYGLLIQPLVFSLLIRRLHDINQSGWLSLLIFVPLINFLFVLALVFWPGKNKPI